MAVPSAVVVGNVVSPLPPPPLAAALWPPAPPPACSSRGSSKSGRRAAPGPINSASTSLPAAAVRLLVAAAPPPPNETTKPPPLPSPLTRSSQQQAAAAREDGPDNNNSPFIRAPKDSCWSWEGHHHRPLRAARMIFHSGRSSGERWRCCRRKAPSFAVRRRRAAADALLSTSSRWLLLPAGPVRGVRLRVHPRTRVASRHRRVPERRRVVHACRGGAHDPPLRQRRRWPRGAELALGARGGVSARLLVWGTRLGPEPSSPAPPT